MAELLKQVKRIDFDAIEKAPPMHTYDVAHWERFLGGPLPDPSLMPQNWNGILSSVAQRHEVEDVKVADLIALIWGDSEDARDALIERLTPTFERSGPQFFKIGFRTCKDTFCTVADNPRDLIGMLRSSERAMEEVSMAKARGWDTLPILLRDKLDSIGLDRTELRVHVQNRRVARVSTAPYEFHTEAMAYRLAKDAWPTLSLISAALPVENAIIDVFLYDGAWWLCDVNPDLPTTWPGHYAYVDEKHWQTWREGGYVTMAHSMPNPEGEFNKFCRVFQLPTGSAEFTRY